MQLHSYLTFDGNCREAMTFYQDCLGGELCFQTVGESPLSEKMPQKMRECILHAKLTKDHLILHATDMVCEVGLVKGNNVSLSLQCTSEEEIISSYSKLSSGGSAKHPFEKNFWGALLVDLTDKYGNHWILSFNNNSNL